MKPPKLICKVEDLIDTTPFTDVWDSFVQIPQKVAEGIFGSTHFFSLKTLSEWSPHTTNTPALIFLSLLRVVVLEFAIEGKVSLHHEWY